MQNNIPPSSLSSSYGGEFHDTLNSIVQTKIKGRDVRICKRNRQILININGQQQIVLDCDDKESNGDELVIESAVGKSFSLWIIIKRCPHY